MTYDAAIVACNNYNDGEVERALREALEKTDGLSFVKAGMRVALKVNLVTAMKPEAAATVHPSVVCAVTRLLRERGAEVIIGDGPGGVFSSAYLRVVYDVCGMCQAEAVGAKLNEDFSVIEASYPDAAVVHEFPYTAYLSKADAIIDLCKLKTHGMMGLTCAVKNFFGSIPGTAKPECHYKYPRAEDFANLLVDLYEYSKPKLCICDAVVGMEGNGPTQGKPREIGCLIVSSNGHLLDSVAADLIGLKVEDVPTIKAASERELIPSNPSIYGEPIRYRVPDFETVPAQSSVFFHVLGEGIPGKIADFFAARIFTPYPNLSKNECIGCGKCAHVCPAKAIRIKKGRPEINRRVCIHCFCCQEFCPKGAMKVEKTLIRCLTDRLAGK